MKIPLCCVCHHYCDRHKLSDCRNTLRFKRSPLIENVYIKEILQYSMKGERCKRLDRKVINLAFCIVMIYFDLPNGFLKINTKKTLNPMRTKTTRG